MGLDIVEFIMLIEDEFGIEFPDEDAEKIRTVGQLRDYLIESIGQDRLQAIFSPGWCRTQQAFYLLRRAASQTLVRNPRGLRASERIQGRITPWQWSCIRNVVRQRAGNDLLPDARRGLLRWPVGLPEGVVTVGDAARLIAHTDEPIPGCRAPLGPEAEPGADIGRQLDARIGQMLHSAFGIKPDSVTADTDFTRDLHLG